MSYRAVEDIPKRNPQLDDWLKEGKRLTSDVTVDVRLAFDAALQGNTKAFVAICRKTGLDPKRMLYRFDSDGRGLWMLPMPVKNALPFPFAVRFQAEVEAHRRGWLD